MLNVSHLNVWYGITEVLRDVSFTVPEGEIVALLGGNGSGKTTILNALTGLVRPRGGSIVLDGQETAGLPTDRRFPGHPEQWCRRAAAPARSGR